MPVDQGNIDLNPREGACRRQSPEAATENDDAWSIDGCHNGRCAQNRAGAHATLMTLSSLTDASRPSVPVWPGEGTCVPALL